MNREIEESSNNSSIEFSSIQEYEKLEEIKRMGLDIEPNKNLLERFGKYIGQLLEFRKFMNPV